MAWASLVMAGPSVIWISLCTHSCYAIQGKATSLSLCNSTETLRLSSHVKPHMSYVLTYIDWCGRKGSLGSHHDHLSCYHPKPSLKIRMANAIFILAVRLKKHFFRDQTFLIFKIETNLLKPHNISTHSAYSDNC